MFGIFPVIRPLQSFVAQFAALLLVIGLVAFSGCRVLSPRPSPIPPVQPPVVHLPNIDESNPYAAFRPIVPEIFTPPMIVQEPPSIEPPRIELQPEIIVVQSTEQSKIDELNQRIEELETQLEEARQAPPPTNLIESSLLDVPPVEPTPIRTMRSLPIINREGVNVYTDESQYARIEIADRFLFMPNAWQLTAEGEETLRVVVAELRAFDSTSVLDIEGHTDSLMGDPNNPMQKHEISSIKTKVVMDFFVNSLRWDAARIGTSSFGRSRPIADNGTPEGRARNNRIEIVIRNGGE